MLRVNRRSNITGSVTSSIYLTLNERTYPTGSGLILKLIGKENNDTLSVTLGSDISINPARYNKFIITDSASADLTNAIVDFNQASYDYYVYAVTGSTEVFLEKGLLKVEGLIDTTNYDLGNTNTEYTFI
jgi:hypothetical protein